MAGKRSRKKIDPSWGEALASGALRKSLQEAGSRARHSPKGNLELRERLDKVLESYGYFDHGDETSEESIVHALEMIEARQQDQQGELDRLRRKVREISSHVKLPESSDDW
jgi:tRNA C32,U32 (ribose-2'-O)-methylase TrmJ